MLAKVAATLDSVADGRLILGLGCGWHEAEYKAFDYPFDHRVGRFEEIVSAVRALLHGERVTVAGTWVQLKDAVILPPPGPCRSDPDRFERPADAPDHGEIRGRLARRRGSGHRTRIFDRGARRCSRRCGRRPDLDPIEIFAGIDATNDEVPTIRTCRSTPRPCRRPRRRWSEEGVDHVRVRVHPGTQANFEIALGGHPARSSDRGRRPALRSGSKDPRRLTPRVSWLLALVPRAFVRPACREEC